MLPLGAFLYRLPAESEIDSIYSHINQINIPILSSSKFRSFWRLDMTFNNGVWIIEKTAGDYLRSPLRGLCRWQIKGDDQALGLCEACTQYRSIPSGTSPLLFRLSPIEGRCRSQASITVWSEPCPRPGHLWHPYFGS
jgi:hypothetical protein